MRESRGSNLCNPVRNNQRTGQVRPLKRNDSNLCNILGKNKANKCRLSGKRSIGNFIGGITAILSNLDLPQIERLQSRHFRTHHLEIPQVDGSGHLEILDLRIVLPGGRDALLQRSGLRTVDDDVFTGRCIVRDVIRLPRRDALAQQFELQTAGVLLRDLDGELVQLAAHIAERLALAEDIGHAVDCDAE